MYKYSFISIFLLLALFAQAQPGINPETWDNNMEKAEELMGLGSYYNAAQYYVKALNLKKGDLATLYKTAEAYRQGRSYADAAKYYGQALEQAKDNKNTEFPLLKYYYGAMLMQNGDYVSAKEQLSSFLNEYSNSNGKEYIELAKNMVKGCSLVANAGGPLLKMKKAEALPKPINSRYTELAPMPYGDNKLLFSSLTSNEYLLIKGQEKYSKIYSTDISKSGTSERNVFDKALNMPNTHVGNGAFSPDGKRLYFTVCNQEIKDNRVGCQIYMTQKLKDTWDKPEKLSDALNVEGYYSSTPTIAAGANEGEEVIYYASNRPGGYGNLDIWASTRSKNGSFSSPVNLGSKVNTIGIETTPFFDNKDSEPTLYFSSNGHPGYGGQDVFKTTRTNTNFTAWSEPSNLGRDLNGPADELYFVVNPSQKNQVFFVSNREGSLSIESKTCCDDIFTAEREVPLTASISGTVFDDKNATVGNARVELYDITDGTRKLVGSLTTGPDGKYNFADLPAGKKYALEVTKDKFKPQTYNFSTEGLTADKDLKKDFYLDAIPVVVVPPKPAPSMLTLSGKTFSDRGSVEGRVPLDNVRIDIYQIDDAGRETLYTSLYSANGGNYRTAIPVGYRYKVVGSKEGHLTASEFVDTRNMVVVGNQELKQDLDLVLRLKKMGLSFKIENIYYDFDSANLRSESIVTLEKLLRLMNDNPTIILEMGSHTDSKGNDAYNQRLSQRRAQSVVDWLVGRGIPSNRLTAKGYGETTPVAPNTNADGSDNPDGRQLNRRTEFKLIGEVSNIRE